MPIETSLPPPVVEYVERMWGPVPTSFSTTVGDSLGSILVGATRSRRVNRNNTTISNSGLGWEHTSPGATFTWDLLGGAPCARLATTGGQVGAAWGSRPWMPYGPSDAGGLNPGYQGPDDALVQVYDFEFAIDGPFAGNPDVTGILWVPSGAVNSNGVASMRQTTVAFGAEGFGGLAGGFGLYAKDAGGGTPGWDYVAWNGTTELERIPISSSVIPDPTAWSSARTVIQGARPGGAARVTVEVNGTVVADREMDNTLLMRPESVGGMNQALGYMPGVELDATGGAMALRLMWDFASGRFRPDGTAVQGV